MRTTRWLSATLAASSMFVAAGVMGAELEVNGTTLQLESSGEGPVVLFVHGAISDHRVWVPYREAIGADHRFVAYDQRYFGTSPWTDDGKHFSIDTHVDDLVGLIEALDAGPVHMVTWSYGGEVGVYAARKRPELFRSVVHFEPAVEALHPGLPGQPAALSQLYDTFGPAMDALDRDAYAEASRRFIEAVFRLPTGAADAFPESYRTMWDDNARTLPLFLELARPPLDCADLATADTPTLVVQGAEAHVLDAMMADQVVRCQPQTVSLTMPGVNHDGPYRAPDRLADIVLSFVSLFESDVAR